MLHCIHWLALIASHFASLPFALIALILAVISLCLSLVLSIAIAEFSADSDKSRPNIIVRIMVRDNNLAVALSRLACENLIVSSFPSHSFNLIGIASVAVFHFSLFSGCVSTLGRTTQGCGFGAPRMLMPSLRGSIIRSRILKSSVVS
jgi:hypothetical protein